MALRVHGLNVTQLKSLLLNNKTRMSALLDQAESIKLALKNLPEKALSDKEKNLYVGSMMLLDQIEGLNDLSSQYDEYLLTNQVEPDDEVNYFTIYTNRGIRKVIAGKSFEDAAEKNGLTEYDIACISKKDIGITNCYTWHQKKREWRNRV